MSILLLGFLIGIYHALEVDHLAAVAALVGKNGNLARSVKTASIWGVGHSLTLVIFGTAAMMLNSTIPENIANRLEFMVGIMLIFLGIDVIRRMLRDKLHYHAHTHADGRTHCHAHSHKGQTEHAEHRHGHINKFPVRAFFVGLMHGMAGSAALILLALDKVQNIWAGILYLALFGFGSIVGMAAVSVLIAIPLKLSSTSMTLLHNGSQGVIGIFSTLVGVYVAFGSL